MSTSPAARREARIAAARAARTNWTPTEEITVKVGEIRKGDFIVRIPQHLNLRGYEINTAATDSLADWTTWRESRRGGWAVESRRITTRLGNVTYPVEAPAVVRRPTADPAA